MLETWAMIDVTEGAARVQAPTLLLHARDELRVPQNEAHLLASLIPNARFVPLDSRNHLMRPAEPAWAQFLAEVDQFLELSPPLSGGLPARAHRRGGRAARPRPSWPS